MRSSISITKAAPSNFLLLFTLYSVVFLGSAGFFITIPAYVELFLTDHSVILNSAVPLTTRREIFGVVMSLTHFTAMFFTPFMAHLSDRYGRKLFICCCLLIAAIGFSLPITAIALASISLLFMGQVMSSLGSASQALAQAVLAEQSYGQRKVKLMSWVAVVMTAAMSFGPALGSKLLALYGVNAPFYACLLIAVFNLLLINLMFKKENRMDSQSQLQSGAELKLKLKQKYSLLTFIKQSRKGVLAALAIMCISQFCWSLYFNSIAFLLPEKWNLPVSGSFYQGLMLAIGVIMILALLTLPGPLLKRFSLSRCLRGSFLLASAAMFILALMPSPWLHVIMMVPVAILLAVVYPFYIARLSSCASENHQGLAMGLATVMIGLAWSVSGYLTTVLVNINLLLPMLLASCGLLLAASLVKKTEVTTL